MSSSNYSISPATEADLPTLTRLLCNSKLTLTINRLLWNDWPNEELQLANYKRAVEGAFKNPAAQTFKAVDNTSGEIVGHLGLTTRKKSPESADANKKLDPQPGMNPEVFGAVINAVTELGTDRENEYLGT
jgi:hypothetical protein